jgi:hypothetical protein
MLICRLCCAAAKPTDVTVRACCLKVFEGNFMACEIFCEIRLPKLPHVRNIRVLAGGNVNDNKVAE